MKKLLLLVFIFCFGKVSFSQYGIQQNLGSNNTLLSTGPQFGGAIKGGIIPIPFSDTTAANLSPIAFYNGALITTTSDSSLWFRSKTTYNLKWIRYASATGGATGSYWSITGNLFPIVPSGYGFGSNDATAIPFKTNGTTRMTLRSDGIPVMSASTDSVLVKNTSGEIGVVAKSSLGSTPTWPQTVAAGATFASNSTANFGANKMTWNFNGGFSQKGFAIFSNTTAMTGNTALFDITMTGDNSNSLVTTYGANISNAHTGDVSTTVGVAATATGGGTTSTAIGLGAHASGADVNYAIDVSAGDIRVASFNSGSSTDSVLTWDATSHIVNKRNVSSFATTSLPISSLTAATGTNSIDNADNGQFWQWNSLSSGSGLNISANTTAAAGSTQTLLSMTLNGANSNSGQTTTGLLLTNTHTGTSSTNVAARFGASSGTNNYAIIVPSGQGSVGIGTSTPNSTTQINGSFATAYTAQTGTYPITATDHTINCTANSFTVTLPTAASIAGREYTIVNSGSGTITIATTSSQTFVNINTAPTTLTLAAVGAGAITSYTVISDGANWIVTGKVKNE